MNCRMHQAQHPHKKASSMLVALLTLLPISVYSQPASVDWILNASWFQYDQSAIAENRTANISVSGSQTTIGVSLTDWAFTWTPSSGSGATRVALNSGDASANYDTDSDTITVTRYFSPWYTQFSYSQVTSDMVISNLSTSDVLSDKQQQSRDWSLEAGRSWLQDAWSWNTYTGVIYSTLSLDSFQTLENIQIEQQEKVTEYYAATGVAVSYFWPETRFTPGLGFDYQRRLSSDGRNETEVFGQRGRSIGVTSGTAQPSGELNWSALYTTLDYDFDALAVSLFYQYELNAPHQDYVGASFYLLF